MTFISNETLFNELQETKRMLQQLIDRDIEHSIEELSLSKAAKQLHLSSDSVIDLVKKGKIKARTYRDNKKKIRYRFRVAEIRKFQNQDLAEAEDVSERDIVLESPEEMADRIFPARKKK